MKRNFNPLLLKSRVLLPVLLFLTRICAAQFTVSGTVETPGSSPLAGMAVLVSGTENKVVYTDANGAYNVSLQAGGTYNIQPLSCEEHPLNGVSTFDMVLIYKHILGVELLNGPYKIIAADADFSNSVGLQDTTVLRNLILGIITEFPAHNFRFVLKDYVFPDPQDPFTPAFPESYSIANLQTDLQAVSFIGIKVGDVNTSSVLPNACADPDLPASIIGTVFKDLNSDCQFSPNEPGMQSWTVSATDGTNTFYGSTNASGAFEIEVLPGTYTLVLSNPEALWGGCADTVLNISAAIQSPGTANFGLQPQVLCPSLQVDLSTLLLRRCFSSYYQVHYCNSGTIPAENARVELQLDTFLQVQSSTIPWSNVSGNTYTFELGDVPAGNCSDFWVNVLVSCDAVLGQTHCSEARIFPDSSCSGAALWNGASLQVAGFCAGNEVKFIIANQGADMIAASNYIVVEDILIMTPPVNNPFILQGGNSEVITVPANGATWRLEAEQPDGYPWGRMASATVEGCGTNATGGFSLGFVNRFPMDDEAPVVDIDCRENIGSYDPNDKQGFPTGVLDEHYIPLDQRIDYLIRFQNTGTDTAFTVVVYDTLDAALEVSSIRPLSSSHSYTFNLLGQNVAQFVFSNILLPDSNVNEAASHGYLKFSIAPKKDILNSTRVENQAVIYFDFNEAVRTNKTWHTLGEQYLDVSNVVFSPGISLDVFPNPASSFATFLLKSASPVRGTLMVFDLRGSLVATQDFEHNQFVFKTKDLQTGCYFFRINAEGRSLAAGKLQVINN